MLLSLYGTVKRRKKQLIIYKQKLICRLVDLFCRNKFELNHLLVNSSSEIIRYFCTNYEVKYLMMLNKRMPRHHHVCV